MFGTGEPRLPELSENLRLWSDKIRKAIDVERIRADVVSLPAPRNRLDFPEAMLKAEEMIVKKFMDAGWPVERYPFALDNVTGIEDLSPSFEQFSKGKIPWKTYPHLEGVNIIATKKGMEEYQKAIVIIGHHDTVRASPGANDNTASVAAILELARVLRPWRFRKSVILAMPDMEELLFIGAIALVKTLLESNEIVGVINYETMGYTAKEPGSQTVPPGMGLLFRQQIKRVRENEYKGDFPCLIYNGVSTSLASTTAAALNYRIGRQSTLLLRDPNDLPVIGKLLGKIVPAVRNFSRSDHVRFWDEGVAALQITDTADFRYKHYHQPTDTPEKVDYNRVADIVAATATVVADVAGLIE